MATRRITSRVLDFSGGIIGGVSDYGRRVKHGRIIENLLLEPLGSLSARKGSQRLSSATLSDAPHSVMEWVASTGAGHVFVGCDGTPGKIFEAKVGAFTAQALPFPLQASAKLVPDQLNGALWVAEQGGSSPPMFMRESNPTNIFHTAVLPRPAFPALSAGIAVTVVSGASTLPGGTTLLASVNAGATTLTLSNNAGTATADCVLSFGGVSVPNCQLTIGSPTVTYDGPGAAAQVQMTLAQVAGGALTALATYWYRLRFRFTDGSSRATEKVHTITLGAGNQTVNLTTIANEIRSDYIGWTLERTKAGGTVNGPFYFLTDATSLTQLTYSDLTADADLGYRSNENVHGEPPHLDGLIAYKDRLVGWAGSTLYFSQAVADIEATGIANWNALDASVIGPDDGDTIKTVVRQVDRLIVLKRWSIWGVEGDDITSFRSFPLFGGAGCSGPRAAAAVGATVYFWGDAGLHRIVGNSVTPFGWVEVGHIFNVFVPTLSPSVVLKNYLGQYLLISFSSNAAYNDDMLAYDLRYGAWFRIKGWYLNDILVQKAGTFGDSKALVTIDRKDRDAGAGFDYPVWLTFYGFRDEKTSAGAGGTAPLCVVETPMIDDGAPDTDKDWEAVQVFLSGTTVAAGITLTMDPQTSVSLSTTASSSGALWGSVTWGSFLWAEALDSGELLALPAGSSGRRYSLRMTASPQNDLTFKGYTMDGIVQPKDGYSRR